MVGSYPLKQSVITQEIDKTMLETDLVAIWWPESKGKGSAPSAVHLARYTSNGNRVALCGLVVEDDRDAHVLKVTGRHRKWLGMFAGCYVCADLFAREYPVNARRVGWGRGAHSNTPLNYNESSKS